MQSMYPFVVSWNGLDQIEVEVYRMAQGANPIEVYLEIGQTRTFAGALDWPGWCRSGKDEATALASLAAYVARYAPVAKKAHIAFEPRTAAAFRVVEHLAGTATTDFGAPDGVARRDTAPLAAP